MQPDTTTPPTPAEPQLWLGLEEYMDSPAFREAMAHEFPEDAAEWTDPVSRRAFISLMGASLALAGAAGCSPRPAPMRKIVPYTRQPEEMTPGVPLYFATACPVAGYVTGVLARSNEGRPTKIEGNPDHPSSLGGTGVIEQGSLLDLYDPDRSKVPTHSGSPTTYEDVTRAVRQQLYDRGGQPKTGLRLRILTGAVTSPTLAARINDLLTTFPEARWVQHEPAGQDNVREGAKRAFGAGGKKESAGHSVYYDFTKADVVVSLDADFMMTFPGHPRYCRDFSDRRKIRQNGKSLEEVHSGKSDKEGVKLEAMNRLYVVECMPTTTGSVADHRLPLLSSQVDAFARALAAKLGVAGAPAAGSLPDAAQKWLDPLANDLRGRRGRCVVVVGEHQPPHVHAIGHAINAALGNIGQTVLLTESIEARPAGKVIDLPALVNEMKAKAVDALLILGGTNPAYTAPADVDFAGTVRNVPFRFHLGMHQDETAALCEWHVNEAHYLEAWGDGRGHDGTIAIQQPLIAPLYAGKSPVEVIADITAAPVRDAREMVRATVRGWFQGTKKSGEFEVFWQEAVRSGVVAGSALQRADKAAIDGGWSKDIPAVAAAPAANEYEINFRPDPYLLDGRHANNGWLQELPRPVTRMSWDNAAYVSPETAKKLSAQRNPSWTAGERGRMQVSILELDYKGRKIKLPVWALPGHPDNAVTVHLGFGRERAGRVALPNTDQTTSGRLAFIARPSVDSGNAEGKQLRGTNVYAIRTADAPWFGPGLKLAKASGTYTLACVQASWSMVQVDPLNGNIIRRDPVRRGTVADYDKNPDFSRIPPGAVPETDAINHNVPGRDDQKKEAGTQYDKSLSYPTAHEHKHDGKEGGHEGHDHRLHPLTMYPSNDNLYKDARKEHGHRWGMAIDLSACTGCSACTIACVSENNTPVVGKQEITRGHDMYWIRVDRYYEGTLDNPDPKGTYFQPVPCQQCEKAPCEVVCPVAATAHTADGLNDMVYNRCVGTRYCSNNCPYKVRRFNFLTFQDWTTESLKLGRNPDVTVRSRGVMEKCTYCVQRIRYAEIAAEREARPVRDGEIRTACQAACPSGAIVFGDLEDRTSRVATWKAEPHNYGLLAEQNTMPRTSYLAAVRNPNPELRQ